MFNASVICIKINAFHFSNFILKYNKCKFNLFKRIRSSRTKRRGYAYCLVLLTIYHQSFSVMSMPKYLKNLYSAYRKTAPAAIANNISKTLLIFYCCNKYLMKQEVKLL